MCSDCCLTPSRPQGWESLVSKRGFLTIPKRLRGQGIYFPNGATDQLVRTVTENSRTLKFDSQGFEME